MARKTFMAWGAGGADGVMVVRSGNASDWHEVRDAAEIFAKHFGVPLPSPGEAERLREDARVLKARALGAEADASKAWGNVRDYGTVNEKLKADLQQSKADHTEANREIRFLSRRTASLEADIAAREKVVEALALQGSSITIAEYWHNCADWCRKNGKLGYADAIHKMAKALDALDAHEAGKGEEAEPAALTTCAHCGHPMFKACRHGHEVDDCPDCDNALCRTCCRERQAEPAATVPEGRKVFALQCDGSDAFIVDPEEAGEWHMCRTGLARLAGVRMGAGEIRRFYLADAPPEPVAEPEPVAVTCANCEAPDSTDHGPFASFCGARYCSPCARAYGAGLKAAVEAASDE